MLFSDVISRLLVDLLNVQVAAGGKLFNVVVDTENTGKQLLQKGGLQRRVTIIPLNKIQTHPVSKRIQDAAVKLVSLQTLSCILSITCYVNKHVIFNFAGWRRQCCSGTFFGWIRSRASSKPLDSKFDFYLFV